MRYLSSAIDPIYGKKDDASILVSLMFDILFKILIVTITLLRRGT